MTINTSNCFFIFKKKKKRQWKRYVSFRTPFLLVVSVVSFTLPFFTHFSLQVASFLALLFLQKFFSLFPTSICWSKITMHAVQTFLSVVFPLLSIFVLLLSQVISWASFKIWCFNKHSRYFWWVSEEWYCMWAEVTKQPNFTICNEINFIRPLDWKSSVAMIHSWAVILALGEKKPQMKFRPWQEFNQCLPNTIAVVGHHH